MRKWLLCMLACMQVSSAVAESISPTTGRALPDEPTAPVVVCVSNGSIQPWGVEHADIVYESILYDKGQTRFAFLFHDALVTDDAIHTGPVRSPREVHAMLMKEWHAGLIANGSSRGNAAVAPSLADNDGWFLNTYEGRGRACASRVTGKKAPDNMDVDVTAVHQALPDHAFRAEGFSFGRMAAEALHPVERIHLDWGKAVTDLFYTAGQYRREGWEGGFANVIVQRVEYVYREGRLDHPVMPAQGEGDAVIFSNGQVIQAKWRKTYAEGKTFYLDEDGREIKICTGRTFIAHLPVQSGILEYQ